LREWLIIQQLYSECSRARILLALLTHDLRSSSGMALGVCLVSGLTALAVLPILTEGWWTAISVGTVVLIVGLLGGLVLEDRAVAAFQYRHSALHLNGLLRRYRRGALGARYTLLCERLRDTDYFCCESLERALRCCDAELEMQRQGQPQTSSLPGGLALTVSVGLLAGAPHLASHGMDALAYGTGLLSAGLAAVLIAWRAAQPAMGQKEQLRCLLVWALEEARSASVERLHAARPAGTAPVMASGAVPTSPRHTPTARIQVPSEATSP